MNVMAALGLTVFVVNGPQAPGLKGVVIFDSFTPQKDCPKEKVCLEIFEIKEKRNEGEGRHQSA